MYHNSWCERTYTEAHTYHGFGVMYASDYKALRTACRYTSLHVNIRACPTPRAFRVVAVLRLTLRFLPLALLLLF